MPMTASDILRNADLFKRAHPGWPHAAPDPDATFTERNNWLRQSLAGRIEVLVPDEAEADLSHAAEKADFDGGEG